MKRICPHVCVIILNWNGKHLLKDCLSSLFRLTDYPNYKVIVVDNGSTDGSVEYVRNNFPQADVLPLDKNYGFAKGNNIGIKYALKKYNPDYILLLNNDTKIIQRDWLTKMVESNYDICQPVILNPDNSVQSKGGGLHICGIPYLITWEEKPFWVSFCCALIKTKLLRIIGLLDETFDSYVEDVDFCWRAKKYCRIGIVNTKIIHYGSISMKKRGGGRLSYWYYYLQSRNVYWTIEKNCRLRLMKLFRVIFSLLEAIALLRKSFKSSIGIVKGIFAALRNPKKNINNYYIVNTKISRLLFILLEKYRKHCR